MSSLRIFQNSVGFSFPHKLNFSELLFLDLSRRTYILHSPFETQISQKINWFRNFVETPFRQVFFEFTVNFNNKIKTRTPPKSRKVRFWLILTQASGFMIDALRSKPVKEEIDPKSNMKKIHPIKKYGICDMNQICKYSSSVVIYKEKLLKHKAKRYSGRIWQFHFLG